MKIVFFVPKLINCGPLNVVLGIVRVLASQPEIRITIVAYRDNHTSDDFMNLFEDLGIKEIYSLEKYPDPIRKVLYLKSLLKDADAIHSHGFFPDLYTSLLPSKMMKIATAHSMFFKDYPATYGSVKGNVYALLHHLVYLNPSFDRIVGCSDSVKDYLSNFLVLNKDKLLTVHNGVDQRSFHRVSKPEKLALRTAILSPYLEHFNPDSKIFIFSGRLTRLKRVPELIKWFNDLPFNSESPNILIILGDGEEMEICKKAAADNENIIFTGFINDVVPFYQLSDYLLSFSAFEGFPMSVLEGISCGCQAILSDIPSHKEVIHSFPTMATLLTNFSIDTSKFSWSEQSAYYLSSVRMAEQYKLTYKSEL